MVSWIKHSVDRFVIVSIFIPKLRLILILNSFLGSSDSLVFSELFHSLAPRPLAEIGRRRVGKECSFWRWSYLFIKIIPISKRKYSSYKFFFSSRRRHTRSVSAFLLNRSSDLLD